MRNSYLMRSFCGLLICAVPGVAWGQLSLQFKRVTNALSSPVFATHAPGDFGRLFIVQRGGQIRILNLSNDTLLGTDFITVPGILSGGEQGLLGLAFHPDYANNGYFYVNFTDNTGGDTRIMRFSVTGDPNVADPGSGLLLMEFDQPQSNHNGGWIGFGPDGYLYIATGDGGGANDSGTGHTTSTGNAQDITANLLGKMLRIDVNGDDFPGDPNRNYAIPPSNPFVGVTGDDEIFLYGLRNPWRCSFDRETFDLYIGDVGQGAREEINVRYAGSTANRNYGWRLREGMIETPTAGIGGPPPADNVNPIYDYDHSGGAFSGFCVTGGYVYRGPIVDLRGHYFFGDYVSDTIWSLKFDQSPQTSFNGTNYNALTDWTTILTTDIGILANVSSFGEDADGNLYVCDLSSELYRLIAGNISTVVPVNSFVRLNGIRVAGGLADLTTSDNAYLTYRSAARAPRVEPPVWIEFFGSAPTGPPEVLCFDIEAHATEAGLTQRVHMYNFVTDQFDLVDARFASTTDELVSVELDGDGSDYVDVDGTVHARVGWIDLDPQSLIPNWRINIDQVRWRFVE